MTIAVSIGLAALLLLDRRNPLTRWCADVAERITMDLHWAGVDRRLRRRLERMR